LGFQGKEILEFFIEELIKNGTTHIPPYEESADSNVQKSPADSAIDVSKEHEGTFN
jgi:cytosine/adenosine deaminase-related metal-dependent hydrolase